MKTKMLLVAVLLPLFTTPALAETEYEEEDENVDCNHTVEWGIRQWEWCPRLPHHRSLQTDTVPDSLQLAVDCLRRKQRIPDHFCFN